MNKTLLAVIAGALVGGVAIAGSQNFATPYAEVVSSTPLTEKEPIYGDVLAADAVTQVVTGSREVCEQVAVERRQPERFGNKDGAVIGALAGALVGSQVGGGNGKKLATVAGAVGGGFAGREIDRRHVGGQRYTAYEQQCRTVSEPREEVIGYDVRYTRDGQTLTTRVDEKVLPIIGDAFDQGRFPKELIPEIASMGLLGSSLPEKYGCANLNAVSYGLICQELERGDSGIRSFVSVQSSLCMYPIYAYGSE